MTRARHWIKAGASLVVVTRGGDSTIAYTATEKVEVPSEKVEVVDTVGAGDTFDAGILASLDMAGLLTKEKVKSLSHRCHPRCTGARGQGGCRHRIARRRQSAVCERDRALRF